MALGRIFGYEPAIAIKLIETTGDTYSVFGMDKDGLEGIFGPFSKYLAELGPRALEDAGEQLEKLQARGYGFVSVTEDCFPKLLKECPDPPAGLYVRSCSPPEEVFGKRCVSVVGTRDISPYGKEFCARTIGALSRSRERPTIVSGMAIGVDITAHMAALGFGLPTIGVLPTGITEMYPGVHRTAADKIASTPGCALVTDFPPGTNPQPYTFLRRNRIIAGMSEATILVESKLKGGGTMTARLAAGYGRDVWAVPGRLDDVRSEGCNLLLREKVAEPLVSLDKLPEDLGLGILTKRRKADLETLVRNHYGSGPASEKTEDLVKIAHLVRSRRGITIEEIGREDGLGYARAAALAGLLESDGFIQLDLLGRCCIDAKNA